MNRLIRYAFVEFFRDLLNGDVVALGICLGFTLFVLVIGACGAWFIWQRKQAGDRFRKKVADKRRKEDEQYKASKKTKPI